MNIIFFSGSRSEYFLLKAVLGAFPTTIVSEKLEFELSVVFGGIYSCKDDLNWREEEKIYLNKKKHRQVGLDVLNNDSVWSSKIPLKSFNYIKKYKNKLIITPHVGGVSIDSKKITREIILEYLYKLIKH